MVDHYLPLLSVGRVDQNIYQTFYELQMDSASKHSPLKLNLKAKKNKSGEKIYETVKKSSSNSVQNKKGACNIFKDAIQKITPKESAKPNEKIKSESSTSHLKKQDKKVHDKNDIHLKKNDTGSKEVLDKNYIPRKRKDNENKKVHDKKDIHRKKKYTAIKEVLHKNDIHRKKKDILNKEVLSDNQSRKYNFSYSKSKSSLNILELEKADHEPKKIISNIYSGKISTSSRPDINSTKNKMSTKPSTAVKPDDSTGPKNSKSIEIYPNPCKPTKTSIPEAHSKPRTNKESIETITILPNEVKSSGKNLVRNFLYGKPKKNANPLLNSTIIISSSSSPTSSQDSNEKYSTPLSPPPQNEEEHLPHKKACPDRMIFDSTGHLPHKRFKRDDTKFQANEIASPPDSDRIEEIRSPDINSKPSNNPSLGKDVTNDNDVHQIKLVS